MEQRTTLAPDTIDGLVEALGIVKLLLGHDTQRIRSVALTGSGRDSDYHSALNRVGAAGVTCEWFFRARAVWLLLGIEQWSALFRVLESRGHKEFIAAYQVARATPRLLMGSQVFAHFVTPEHLREYYITVMDPWLGVCDRMHTIASDMMDSGSDDVADWLDEKEHWITEM